MIDVMGVKKKGVRGARGDEMKGQRIYGQAWACFGLQFWSSVLIFGFDLRLDSGVLRIVHSAGFWYRSWVLSWSLGVWGL